jgi:hypothetical protein
MPKRSPLILGDFGFFGQSLIQGPLTPQYLDFFELDQIEDEFDPPQSCLTT